jgi:FtsP/CotA-like multicopper oxidase with cupredoxin domain
VVLALALAFPAAGADGRSAAARGQLLQNPRIYQSHLGVLNVTLVAEQRRVIVGGQQVTAKVYNGAFAAPTLMVRPGDLVRVKLVNKLDEPTNLHFHGLNVNPGGHGDNIYLSINPGRSFQYSFRLPRNAPAGSFWYHSHEMVPTGPMPVPKTASLASYVCHISQASLYPDDDSEEQVFDGLSGLFEVQGLDHDLPRALRALPQRYLAIRDVQISGGKIVSTEIDSNAPTTRLVDGQLDPRITIEPGQTQLWHIGNIGADIFYNLKLPGHRFDVIAQDGHPVIHAEWQSSLMLPPGKRFDVLVRGTSPGTAPLETMRVNEGDDHYPKTTLATLVTTGKRQTSEPLPNVVSWASVDLRYAHIIRKRMIILGENRAGTQFSINGQFYDPSKINFRSRFDTTEQWTIVNHTDELHVFHMHTWPMQLLSVNGVPAPFDGYQDEIVIPIHGYVVMRIRFDGYTGITVFHCHILSHEDAGMMANIEVTK